jgi:hypothetical protein
LVPPGRSASRRSRPRASDRPVRARPSLAQLNAPTHRGARRNTTNRAPARYTEPYGRIPPRNDEIQGSFQVALDVGSLRRTRRGLRSLLDRGDPIMASPLTHRGNEDLIHGVQIGRSRANVLARVRARSSGAGRGRSWGKDSPSATTGHESVTAHSAAGSTTRGNGTIGSCPASHGPVGPTPPCSRGRSLARRALIWIRCGA